MSFLCGVRICERMSETEKESMGFNSIQRGIETTEVCLSHSFNTLIMFTQFGAFALSARVVYQSPT